MPPRSAAARAPIPVAGQCWPMPQQETDTQRQDWLSLCGVSGSWWAQGFVWALQHLWQVCSLILYVILPFLPPCWASPLPLDMGYCFFGGIQHYPVNGCSAASCSFRVLAEEDECMSFYSTILNRWSFHKPFILIHQRADRMETTITENQPNGSHGSQACLTQWNYEPCHIGPPKTDG